MDKEGSILNRPPVLDGSNYEFWKVRMIAFLKTDPKAWKAVVKGWDPPMVRDKDGKTTDIVKPEEDCDDEDDKLAQGNSKALTAIFNGVDKSIFRLIKNCTVEKEA